MGDTFKEITPSVSERQAFYASSQIPNISHALRSWISMKQPELLKALQSGDAYLINAAVKKVQESCTSDEWRPSITNGQTAIRYLERERKNDVEKQKYMANTIFCGLSPFNYALPLITCSINGVIVKGLIDTGAQSSVMSRSMASYCNLLAYLDDGFQAKAVGVGEQQILGRIPICFMDIPKVSKKLNDWLKNNNHHGNNHNRDLYSIEVGKFELSLLIIEQFHSSYFLLGQDFLQIHHCIPDSKEEWICFRNCRGYGIELYYYYNSDKAYISQHTVSNDSIGGDCVDSTATSSTNDKFKHKGK